MGVSPESPLCRAELELPPILKDAGRSGWSEHPNMRNWTVLGGPYTKKIAQAIETTIAVQQGCQSSPGGNDPDQARRVVGIPL